MLIYYRTVYKQHTFGDGERTELPVVGRKIQKSVENRVSADVGRSEKRREKIIMDGKMGRG